MKMTRVIINITIPIVLLMLFASLLTTKQYLVLSKGLYESHERIDFDHDYAADKIMGYLNYRYDDLEFGMDENDDSVIMRQTELDHMEDVKNLYTSLRIVALSALFIGVSLSFYQYKKDRKELYKTYKSMPLGPFFFILFLGSFMVIDFDSTFTKFHELFFSNDDWLLYYDDVLIMLLPQNFWLVSGLIILVLFGTALGTMYIINEKLFRKNSI
jgi:integral membrane protein (TIGR01906 family)